MELTITEKAADALKNALSSETDRQAEGIRLGVSEAGCCGSQYSLSLAEAGSEAEIMAESQGIKVFVPKERMDFFEGTVIDFVTTEVGEGFHIARAKTGGGGGGGGGCGCGGGGHGHGGGQGHGGGHGHGGGGCGC